MSATEVLLHPTELDLTQSVAARLITRIVERQADRGSINVVLTGGTIGTAVLAEVAASPGRDSIDWQAIDLWWGDERFLANGHPERNDATARRALLDHVDVDPERVHPIPGPDLSPSPEHAAAEYARLLARHCRPEDHGDVPAFEVLLLGMGPDGHIASLFPESPGIHEASLNVVAVHGSPKPPPTRVSLTLHALSRAVEVWLLVSGEAKSSALRLALDQSAGPLQIPAAGVHGRERTLFMVDGAAASRLPAGLARPVA